MMDDWERELRAEALWDNNYDTPWLEASEQDKTLYRAHAESLTIWEEYRYG